MLSEIFDLLTVVGIALLFFFLPYLVFSPAATKAGFSKWWSLLLIIPVVNIVVVWVFAAIRWPVEKDSA